MTSLALLADKFAPPTKPPSPYLRDPAAWVADRLGETLWSKQIEIMQSVVVNRRTAVRSCHGVGKSYSAARLIAWWIETHPLGDAFVVSTAPTNPQVEAILWREVNKAFPKANPPLPGRILTREWKIGNELVAYGRKPADYDANAFQGIHARYVLVILDEAGGIPEQLWTAAGALVTNEGSRILAVGNPDDPTSYFAKVCQPGSGWSTLQIRAADSPNFTGEAVPPEMLDMLVSQAYLDDLIADGCGPGTSIWTSKVEGEFPEDCDDSVVRPSAVAKCRLPEQSHDTLLPVELGVDVGAGGDYSVVIVRRGPVASLYKRVKTPDTMTLVGIVMDAISETGATRVKIDKTGIGQGVTDRLNELRAEKKHHAQIVGVMVGSGAHRSDRFPKLRDELWWQVGRTMSENGAWDLSQLDDATAAQLTSPRWAPDSSGRIKVERKEETRKRIGRSPDDADALLLAFYSGSGSSGAKEWLEALAPLHHCPDGRDTPNRVGLSRCRHCGEELPPYEPPPPYQPPPTPEPSDRPKPFNWNSVAPEPPPNQQAIAVMEMLQQIGRPPF